MNIERLTSMVNDMAHFFAAEPDRQAAVEGIAGHLRKFWEPRMRAQIVAHLREGGGEGLEPLALDGVRRLADMQEADTAGSAA